MNQPPTSSSISTTLSNPLDVIKSEWFVFRQRIQTVSLIIEHSIQIPNEIEFSDIDYHILGVHLSPGIRQIARIGEQKYDGAVDKGDCLLHPAHYRGFYSRNSTDECVVFLIKPDFLTRTASQTECLNPNRVELNPLVLGRDRKIEQITRSFLSEMQSDALGSRLYSETLATQLAIHLLRHYCTFPAQLKQYDKGLSHRQLEEIINYIEAYLKTNISLKELATMSDLSPHYFCHLFKRSTGIAPYQYVIQQRIAKAKQLLKQTELTLVDIALECGFANQSALNRTFKKRVGITPRKYRQGL